MTLLILLMMAGEITVTNQHFAFGVSFRGLSALDAETVWASGSEGTVLATTDGGKTWKTKKIGGAKDLDFRDVHALDARTVLVQSAGPGAASRIYRSENRGKAWKQVYQMSRPAGFFDGIAFWDGSRGIAYSDPVEGRFFLLATEDGGETWRELSGLPPALDGEASFAASGTGIHLLAPDKIWFGTGGQADARVFHSPDGGQTWTVTATPLRAGDSAAGCFSLVFWDEKNGCAVGGKYDAPEDPSGTCVVTNDGGRSWRPAKKMPRGYRSAVAIVPGAPAGTLVAVGPNGIDLSADGGETWTHQGGEYLNAIAFPPGSTIGWVAGESEIHQITWTP